MHAQILQVRVRDEGAQGVGHTADADLQGDAVPQVGEDVAGDLAVDLGGSGCRSGGQVVMLAFNDDIHFRDVHVAVVCVVGVGHVLVDFKDDGVRCPQHFHLAAVGQAEAEEAVLVHGGDSDHSHVDGCVALGVVQAVVTEEHGGIVSQTLVAVFAVQTGAVPCVEGEGLLFGVLFHHLDGAHGDGVADLDILQLLLTGSQCGVQQEGEGTGLAVVHPIAVLDDLDRLFRGAEFGFVFFIDIHMR